MKNILPILFILATYFSNAQNTNGKLNDIERIALTTYLPENTGKMTDEAKSYMTNKLSQITSNYGIGSSELNQQFIITANVNIVSKDILPSTPAMQAITLECSFFIGDGIKGTLFSSISKTVKGVGENETKALMSALKNIKTNDSTFKEFFESAKQKIVKYYSAQCDFIIKEAQTLASQNKFEEAIYKLTTVPEISKNCYDNCMDAVGPFYKKYVNRECKRKLSDALSIWESNQTIEAANQVGKILSSIDPDTDCSVEVKNLMIKVSQRVKEIDAREWDYKLKEQTQISELINAYREIGVAYGNSQPQNITYNIAGWW
jgi:hypothetical protein